MTLDQLITCCASLKHAGVAGETVVAVEIDNSDQYGSQVERRDIKDTVTAERRDCSRVVLKA